MNLRQIEAFRAVMVAGTVTQAGEMLHISQPAVSRLIGDLERAIRFKLFDRRRGRLVPTTEGKSLFREVEKAFVGMDHIADAAQAIGALRRGHLSIVAIPILAHGFLPHIIAEFLKRYPDVSIHLETVQSTPTVVEWIASQQYDLGLGVLPVEDPAITARPFSRRKALCVLPAGHRLASKPAVHAADLEGEYFISMQKGSVFRFRVDEMFEKAGVRRKLRVETSTRQAACDMVAAGIGIAIVGPLFARDMTERHVILRPFEPAIVLEHGVLFPAFNPPSLVTEGFAELIVKYTDRHFPNDR